MLFETLSQPKIFITLVLIGFFSGFIFDLGNYIAWLCKKNKVVQAITDFFATVAVFFVFFVVILKIDYGKIRLYQLFAFFLFFLFQRFTLGKLIAKFFDWCYNHFKNTLQKLLKGFQKKKNEKHKQPTNKTL